MKPSTPHPSTVHAERVTALVALALLAVLGIFLLNDARLAVGDVETWGSRVEAAYPVNEFV